ncbi:MAG: hypothetical protein ACYS8X_13645 [Planctomycetota bacterium]|jgi:hypothetical protein
MIEWLTGKKTYLVGVVTFLIAGIEALAGTGLVDWQIPAWLYAMLGSLGLLALRAGVTKAAKEK